MERLRPGAWLAQDPELDAHVARERAERARCRALSRQLRSDHVFSHATAALWHGCRLWRLEAVADVVQEWSATRALAGDVRRHRVSVPAEDCTEIDGLPVTSLERTLVDCARSMHPRDGLVIVDSGLALLAEPDRWHREESEQRIEEVRARLMARLAEIPGQRGVRRARAVIEYADAFAESSAESALRWLAVARGMPRPISQVRLEVAGTVYFGDLGWRLSPDGAHDRERFFVAEFDGRVKYAGSGDEASAAVVDEKIREDRVREAGHMVRRFVSDDLATPDSTFQRLVGGLPIDVRRQLRAIPELQVLPRRRPGRR